MTIAGGVAALNSVAALYADSGKKSSSGYSFLIFIALIGLAMYMLFLRPQRKRAQRAQQLQTDLAPGTQVMTTAGLYGTVAAVEDDAVVLEVAPGVTTRWARAAVARVVPTDEPLGLDGPPERVAGADAGPDPHEPGSRPDRGPTGPTGGDDPDR